MAYGDKRDYRKIDIFVNGKYRGSTTWARTLKEAEERWLSVYLGSDKAPKRVKACYAPPG